MSFITKSGEVLKNYPKDCRGVGCPFLDCRLLKTKSEFVCLGRYIMVESQGMNMWECEFHRPKKNPVCFKKGNTKAKQMELIAQEGAEDKPAQENLNPTKRLNHYADTSRSAFGRMTAVGHCDRVADRVYNYIKSCCGIGATREEVEISLGLSGNSSRPAVKMLLNEIDGKIYQKMIARKCTGRQTIDRNGEVVDLIEKRPTRSGNLAEVLIAL